MNCKITTKQVKELEENNEFYETTFKDEKLKESERLAYAFQYSVAKAQINALNDIEMDKYIKMTEWLV